MRTFMKFQDKVSETFIVHEKVQEILLVYNNVRFSSRQGYRNISSTRNFNKLLPTKF